MSWYVLFFFFQAEDGIRDVAVTGVQTCALPIYWHSKIGTPPMEARISGSRSSSMKSPGRMASSCSTVASARASSATRVTSAAWISRLSTLTQRSEEHTSELQSRLHLVCRLLLE